MEERALGRPEAWKRGMARLKPWKRGMARLEPWEGGEVVCGQYLLRAVFTFLEPCLPSESRLSWAPVDGELRGTIGFMST